MIQMVTDSCWVAGVNSGSAQGPCGYEIGIGVGLRLIIAINVWYY